MAFALTEITALRVFLAALRAFNHAVHLGASLFRLGFRPWFLTFASIAPTGIFLKAIRTFHEAGQL